VKHFSNLYQSSCKGNLKLDKSLGTLFFGVVCPVCTRNTIDCLCQGKKGLLLGYCTLVPGKSSQRKGHWWGLAITEVSYQLPVPGESCRALLLRVGQQKFVIPGLAGSKLGVCNPNYGTSNIPVQYRRPDYRCRTGTLPVTSGEGKWVVELLSGFQTKANTVHLDIERPLPRGSLRAGLLKHCRVVRCPCQCLG